MFLGKLVKSLDQKTPWSKSYRQKLHRGAIMALTTTTIATTTKTTNTSPTTLLIGSIVTTTATLTPVDIAPATAAAFAVL